MKVIDWQILSSGINNEVIDGFVLYGASSTGKRMIMLLRELNLYGRILAVVDSDKKKWGNKWMGYTISSPDIINSFLKDAIIVITSVYLDEIYKFLKDKVKCQNRVCSSFSLQHAFHYELMSGKSSYFTEDIALEYKKKYELWKNNLKSRNSTLQQKEYFETIKCIIENPISILLCGIQKTGNTSLMDSFEGKKWTNVAFTRHALYFDKHTLSGIRENICNFSNHEIKIISGIREPVERIISQTWEHISIPFLYNDTFVPDILNSDDGHFITELTKYEEISGRKYDCTSCFYIDIADWFKDHIEKVFGINVFDYNFDKEKGYSVIKKDNVSIFIYRLDKLDKLEKEICMFTGSNTFKLKRGNVASGKKYIFAYREYLKRIKIQQSFFNGLIDSKGMTHFYTKEECEIYKHKWQDKLI
ncbi:MAG: hypothetical protein HFH68_09015 [Lachnospiraceae bacterium]|nr:hypothetical protein [Lachnospiraceae bacterium]